MDTCAPTLILGQTLFRNLVLQHEMNSFNFVSVLQLVFHPQEMARNRRQPHGC